jgi:hypothetical protein
MKIQFFLLFICLFIFSCSYPDIDSVPNFDNLKLTKEESIDLCKLNHSDILQINECLNKLNIEDKE